MENLDVILSDWTDNVKTGKETQLRETILDLKK